MSQCIESSSRSNEDASSRDLKPRHVRRLKFGKSILELDVARDQRPATNRALVIDQKVAHIPCTEKRDYVRMWLETQNNNASSRNDPSQLSPVLGTSSTNKITESSPILTSSVKRRRKKAGINRRRVAAKKVDNADSWEKKGAGRSAICTSPTKLDYKEHYEGKNEYQQERFNDRASPRLEKVADERSSEFNVCYKEKRRKFSHKVEDGISPRWLKLDNNKVTSANINPPTLDNNCSIPREKVKDENQQECFSEGDRALPRLEKVANETSPVFNVCYKDKRRKFQHKVEDGVSPRWLKLHDNKVTSTNINPPAFDNNCFLREVSVDCDKSEPLLLTQDILKLEDSSSNDTNKKISKIYIDTSDNSKSNECNECELSNAQSSSDNLDNLIENDDTQETAKTSLLSIPNESLVPSKQPFALLQTAADGLDKMYYSENEIVESENTPLSIKISQVPSFNKTTQRTDSKSNQTDAIISSITTPSKKSPDKSIFAHLLDSGKRLKYKKGSMVSKLRSLINAQVSNIRIWRHQMNKESNAASMQFISVFVHNCTKQFGNQFLEGTLIEDSFNLLHRNVEIEEAESQDVQAQPKKLSHKNITIMLVCDIVGTLKMSKIVINVYPPWNVLDERNLTLEASYININENCKVPDYIRNRDNSHKFKKRVVKEFNCPCIEEGRELPFCARKPSSDKPDVMQQIFDF